MSSLERQLRRAKNNPGKMKKEINKALGDKVSIDFMDRELPKVILINVEQSELIIGEPGKTMRQLPSIGIGSSEDDLTRLFSILDELEPGRIDNVILRTKENFKHMSYDLFYNSLLQHTREQFPNFKHK